MKNKVRYGIVGSGEISMLTCQGMEMCEHSEIAMTMDVREDLSRDLAEKYNVKWTTSLDEILASEDIDAIYIAVPHFLHKEVAVKSARAQKHIILEKPIALNAAEAAEINTAAKDNGIRICIAMVRRYRPNLIKIRDLIAAGAIGDVISVFIPSFGCKKDSYWQGGFTSRNVSDWRMKRETSGGGVLIMNMFHDLDVMNFATGLDCVSASGLYDTFITKNIEVEDYITATLKYENGAIGTLIATSAAQGASPEGHNVSSRIFGTRGQIVIAGDVLLYCSEPFENYEAEKWHSISTPALDAYEQKRDLFDDFSLSLSEDRTTRVDIDKVMNTQQVCDWIYNGG